MECRQLYMERKSSDIVSIPLISVDEAPDSLGLIADPKTIFEIIGRSFFTLSVAMDIILDFISLKIV